jgi:hypothetical protein
MAKNPPLVGHFPVCRLTGDQVHASGAAAGSLTPARQEAAFILEMSAPPPSGRSRLGLALRMLWKKARDSMHSKHLGPAGRNLQGLALRRAIPAQKLLDRTHCEGVECAALQSSGQDAQAGGFQRGERKWLLTTGWRGALPPSGPEPDGRPRQSLPSMLVGFLMSFPA